VPAWNKQRQPQHRNHHDGNKPEEVRRQVEQRDNLGEREGEDGETDEQTGNDAKRSGLATGDR